MGKQKSRVSQENLHKPYHVEMSECHKKGCKAFAIGIEFANGQWLPQHPELCAAHYVQAHGRERFKEFCTQLVHDLADIGSNRQSIEAIDQDDDPPDELVIRRANLAHAQFEGAGADSLLCFPPKTRFKRFCIDGARFTYVEMEDAVLEESLDYANGTPSLAPMRDVVFHGCHLSGTTFGAEQLIDVAYQDCDLTRTCFGGSHGVEASNLRLKTVDFRGSILNNATLVDATLDGVGFLDATISALKIKGGSWRDVDLSFTSLKPEAFKILEQPLKVGENCFLPTYFARVVTSNKMIEGDGFRLVHYPCDRLTNMARELARTRYPRWRIHQALKLVLASAAATLIVLTLIHSFGKETTPVTILTSLGAALAIFGFSGTRSSGARQVSDNH